MPKLDPDQERRRLIDFYAGQLDGELEKIAGTAYELTDIAKEALRAELAKRGLTPTFRELPPSPPETDLNEPQPGDPPLEEPPDEEPAEDLDDGEVELRTMVTVRRFRDLPDALLAKTCLDSAGIECLLIDDNTVRLDWLWSNVISGVKLKVDPADAETAHEVLSQPIPERFEVAGIGEFQQPHCPKCQSLDVTYRELNRPASYLTLWLNVPIPIYRRAWRCHSCNVEWEDDGLPTPTDSSL